MLRKVLLIEDSIESKDLVFSALAPSFGFEMSWAPNLADAGRLLTQNSYDLILLDVALPDGDGFHFFSMLKNEDKNKDLPVVFLTAHDSVSDKVLGFSLGAEDYIVKPFSAAELRARVEIRLKKYLKKSGDDVYISRKGDLEINLHQQRVFLNSQNGGSKVDLGLTPLEFKLFVHMSESEERVFSREQLLSQVWGENTHLTDRCIDTHMYAIRKKLGPLSVWIESVYGQGYRFSSKAVVADTKMAA